MFKMKGTKRSLLMSVLALLLCVSMLIGSTFAWFTDSVTSAGNIIKSGKLEVTMEWKDATATGAQQTYKNAAAGPIFNYDKWEPGYVEAKNVKISNVGTLALKYQLNILPNGEVSKLADVIDVYFAEGEITLANREMTALKRIGTLSEVLAGMPANMSGDLEAEKNDTVTIALKMQEDAGNEYQDKSIGTTFSIQLLATQLTAEFDSFGPDYAEDAALGTYIELDADADLLAAMASAKKDMPLTIKLNGNVEWPTEGHHGENDVTPASSILIDGNGYTITATGAGVTPLGDNNAPMTLKNVKIVDNSASYNEGAWELTYLEMGGSSLTCYNVTFADEIQIGTNATFTNCSFESNEESVYAVWVEDGSATFDNCTFTGYRGLKAHEAYGTEVSAVIVKDCVFSNLSMKPGMAIGTLNADTTVSITGSTFINCQAGDQRLYIYETDTDVANFNFKEENNSVLNNATIVSTNATGLAEAIAKGGVVFIATDIDMNNAWTSVVPANGLTILGNGHTITNLNQPLLAGKGGPVVTVKGLTIADSNVGIAANEKGLGTGAFMAFADYSGTVVFEDCHLLNSTVTGDERAAAFIAYSYANLTIKDCSVKGCTIKAVGSTAGLAAHVNGNTTIENSSVKNTKVTATEDRTGKAAVAGAVVGTINNNTAFTNVTASNNTVSNTGATPVCNEIGRIVSGNWIVDGVSYKQVAAGLFVNPDSEENDWFVLNAEGLANVNAKIADKSLGKGASVTLLDDIDFSGKVWTTVDSHVDFGCYISEINGNGHTISNLTVNGQAMFRRFAGVGDVVIKDVTFDGAAINSTALNSSILTVQAYQNVLLDNVDVKNSAITGSYKVATLIGSVYNENTSAITATLKNCDVSNTTVTSNLDFMVTGLVAFVNEGNNDKIVFENCSVTDVALIANSKGYNAMAAVYCNDGSAEGSFDEVAGVVVKNVTKN